MKIGLFITGHLRDHIQTKENYSQFLQHGDNLHVYVSTWDHINSVKLRDDSSQLVDDKVDPESIYKNVFGDSLKGIAVFPPSTADVDFCSQFGGSKYSWGRNSHPPFQFNRLLSQYYIVKEAYNLCPIDEYESFDVVIRIRADMSFGEHCGPISPRTPPGNNATVIPIPFVEHYTGSIHSNGYGTFNTADGWSATVYNQDEFKVPLELFTTGDHIFWGTPHWMKKFLTFYDHFVLCWGPITTHPKNFWPSIEHIMAWYMYKYPFFNKDTSYENILEQVARGEETSFMDMPPIIKHGTIYWMEIPLHAPDLYRICRGY